MIHLRNIGAIVSLASLSGCGFQPLYASEASVGARLSQIEVTAPADRSGELLRGELNDALASSASAVKPYQLRLTTTERRYPRGLRVDDTANRYELRLAVTYQLVQKGAGQIAAGTRIVSVTYDVADAPYAGVQASLDGQERAAREAARLIRTDLARSLTRLDKPLKPPRR